MVRGMGGGRGGSVGLGEGRDGWMEGVGVGA